MRAIEDLKNEHRVIELVLIGLGQLARHAEKNHKVNQEKAGKALERAGIPNENGPIGLCDRLSMQPCLPKEII